MIQRCIIRIYCTCISNQNVFSRIFAVHADYGLTLTLGVALLLKYVFVDRHQDMLEVKHAIDLQRAMSAVDVVTQTEEYAEEEGITDYN